MRTIDADYLQNVINGWKNQFDKESTELKMLEQFEHCVKAQRTVVDIQGAINSIKEQKMYYNDCFKEDIQPSVLYNGGIDDAVEELKCNINPDLRDSFNWNGMSEQQQEDTDYEIS